MLENSDTKSRIPPEVDGIQVNFCKNQLIRIMSGFTNEKVGEPPKVVLHFQIWGREERNDFKELFQNYQKGYFPTFARSSS